MTDEFSRLASRIGRCMISERHRLRRQLRELRGLAKQGRSVDKPLAILQQRLKRSEAQVQQRQSALPAVDFPPDLPVSQRAGEIETLIRQHQVVILCGETGSGKSTQLPKICLGLGRGVFGKIAHTQPRRIAARSLASRISSELGRELGTAVGYKVRFHDRVGPQTYIKLLTDGMLLAEIQRDRFLNEYDTIILDEAHERSLNIDFLLGYLKQLLKKRSDLKLIVTSATIDPQKFSRHFDNAPVIEVSGRSYPVEVRYLPPHEEDAAEQDDPLQQVMLEAVDELSHIDRGDILLFLSGEREIREMADRLGRHGLQSTEILPLYARLSPAEQGRIFKPSGQRRIVLATNVAETSLTVPGIRHVIDAGFARISRYSHKSKIQRLPIERISRASADQRKGRCGRVAPGVCIRLYSEESYLNRAEFTEPEIQRTNLAAVILQMKVLGFGDIRSFPFIDPPDPRQIKDGYRVLHELGAVDGLDMLTQLGRKLARLPVDPRVGRMLLEAAHSHCLKELLVIASALSVQDPRDRPMDKRQQADAAHALFRHEESDFLGILSLWEYLEDKRRHLSQRKFRRLCREHFISYTRVQEWRDIHIQLRTLMHEMGYRDNQQFPGYESIHRALLSGLLSHVGFRQSEKGKGYLGARNSRFHIFPGSSLFEKQPKWLVAAELVETSKLYARTNALIRPEWVESLAGHLLKRSYSEPHWQSRRGQVGAYEKVTLFGLTLVPRRRVNYGPIDPAESRKVFIRTALVDGDFHSKAPFWRHNQELLAYVRDLEARTRRPDLLVDEDKMLAFYENRIPEGIYSKARFEKWLRSVSRKQPKLLHMRLEDLMQRGVDQERVAQFPTKLNIGEMILPLEYRFEPGHEADGVTLVAPAAALAQISPGRLDWLVPGLLQEKIVALMKSLPKSLRKQFVPVPETANRAMAVLQPTDTPLIQALGAALKQIRQRHVPEDAWDESVLSDYLRMRIRVVDAQGKTLAASRNLLELQQRFKDQHFELPMPSAAFDGDGRIVTREDFPALPEVVESHQQGFQVRIFPALHDAGDRVQIKGFSSEAEASLHHQRGLRRLLMQSLGGEIRTLQKQLGGLQQMRLQYFKAPRRGEPIDLEQELLALILDHCFLLDQAPIRDGAAFNQRLQARQADLPAHTAKVLELSQNILSQYQQLRKTLSGITQINWLATVQDAQAQLDRLVFQGFLTQIPWRQLQHYPRYLKALLMRLDKLRLAPARDQQRMQELKPVQDEWLQRYQPVLDKAQVDPRLEEIRWLLEEFRVSLFAQELKTACPVSAKRIRRRWQELGL